MRSVRGIAIGFAVGIALGGAGGTPALAAGQRPRVLTSHGCYRVGQAVRVTGSGFAPKRLYDIAIDGVDFGQNRTDAAGGFRTTLVPGGLGAGIVQHVSHLNATDGSSAATARFTLTRSTGARFVGAAGSPRTLRASFQAWGFGLDGAHRSLFLHYVSPSGRALTTVRLGRAGGQCGYLRTQRRPVFPFSPSAGRWTLQIDSAHGYSGRPKGSVARIRVGVS